MKLKPYPEYKDSGVPWLGETPAHWDMKRVKYLFDERTEKGLPNEPLLAATQTKGVVLKTMYENRTVMAQKDLHLFKLVEADDFVISLRSFQGGIERAYYRGIISPAYTVMIPQKEIIPDYFKHLAKSKIFLELLKTCVTGIREGQNIDYSFLRKAFLPRPACEEQAEIAHFLDWKTAQINKFIRNKRRLIGLLKEQKQNIINRAVTRGLDPNVKLKPSGVEWLGDIPEHWEMKKVQHIFKRIGSGTTPQSGSLEYYSGEIPWVVSGDLTDGYIERTTKKVTDVAFSHYSALKIYPINSLIVAMYGATIGKVGLTKIITCTNQACCVLTDALSAIDMEYMLYFFIAIKLNLIRMGYGGGQPNISQDTLRMLRVPIPPIKEQKYIINQIKILTRALDQAISRAEREIELMTEYRARLISDVVTGKVDVRGIDVPQISEDELPAPDEETYLEDGLLEEETPEEEIEDADE